MSLLGIEIEQTKSQSANAEEEPLLTVQQVETIAEWIACGAPDN